MQAPIVIPIDPAHGRVFDVGNVLKRPSVERISSPYCFGFKQSNCRLSQGIIVRVADASNRSQDPFEHQFLGKFQGNILRSCVGMVE
jgi:hypothetical protein